MQHMHYHLAGDGREGDLAFCRQLQPSPLYRCAHIPPPHPQSTYLSRGGYHTTGSIYSRGGAHWLARQPGRRGWYMPHETKKTRRKSHAAHLHSY